tara:strand:+ start:190 stop:822 length:633 start_codon:yes stop_codon:yes gene_type:complete
MRNTLLLIAIATTLTGGTLSASTQPGWGSKQTQRTVQGAVLGGTIGGVIGHQHDKQKEGIIIGSVLGMIIGNKSGKGVDARNEQQRQEQIAREQAHQRELQRREQERRRQYQYRQTRNTTPVVNHGGSVGSPDDELTRARHRAEQREAELHREMEIRRIQEERRRALLEYQERERRAQEQLEKVRNGESVQTDSPRDYRYSQNRSHSPVY